MSETNEARSEAQEDGKRKKRNPSAVTTAKFLRSALENVNGLAERLRADGWHVEFAGCETGTVSVQIKRIEREVTL